MGRSCIELLEPHRYRVGAANFLLAEANLSWPDEPPSEASHVSCGLLDLSATPLAAATLAVQEAALLEGRTGRHVLGMTDALVQADRAARDAGAVYFDCVVALPTAVLPSITVASWDRLPGAWFAITTCPAELPTGLFDIVITSRGSPSTDAGRVFRMVSSLMAQNTANCMDMEDFIGPLKAGDACLLVDAFALPGSEQVQLVHTEEQALLARAKGIVVVQQFVSKVDTVTGVKRMFNSIRGRAPAGVPATFYWPIGHRADLAASSVRPVDILIAL